MTNRAESLKEIIILDSSKVVAIRSHIAATYPNLTRQEAATYFAKAIRRIIDEALSTLELSLQADLRNALIKDALLKEHFSISGYDLLKLATALTDDVYIEGITKWVNTVQHTTLSSNELVALAQQTIVAEPNETHTTSPKVSNPSTTTTDALRSDISLLIHLAPYTSKKSSKKLLAITLILISGGLLSISVLNPLLATVQKPQTLIQGTFGPFQIPGFAIDETDYLQAHLQYKEINEAALLHWLQARHSLLSEEPYFSTIISAAHAYNINPLLMFAITGQEQGFVPNTHAKAHTIANNPFNVYGSWEDFNTSIADTATIAARTIINLSKGCPSTADPIKWLNQKYAEDPNWHIGVTFFLNELEKVAGNL